MNITASQTLKVGIQGGAGAFHEIAARQFFQQQAIDIVPALTFPALLQALSQGNSMHAAIMAIENTLAGSIMENYKLLQEHQLSITGEHLLPIRQNLMALPGSSINSLTEVHSHPVAIAQCRQFFKQYPHIQLVETYDTALSARDIQFKQSKHIGAIASSLAAQLYGLDILAAAIETNKQNHTRFLILQKQAPNNTKANKVSLSFSVHHQVGSLHKVLAVLAAYNVNLSKIQSTPIIGKPWEYRFFIDFLVQDLHWQQAVDAIRPITTDLHLMGAYQAAHLSKSEGGNRKSEVGGRKKTNH